MSTTTVDDTAGGYAIRVLVPDNYAGHAVVYHHGVGETATSINTTANTVIVRLLADGYIVAASTAQYDNWGSPDALAAYAALQAYLDTNYAPTKFAIWSTSMGGCSGLLTASQRDAGLVAWFGIYPVCNLAQMYSSDVFFAAQIRSAYGMASDGSDYAEKAAGHDPVLLDGSLFDGLPMRFYASAADTVVAKDDNTDAMAVLVGPYASESDVIVCTGDHGDASHYQPDDVSDFLALAFAPAPSRFGTVFSGIVRSSEC